MTIQNVVVLDPSMTVAQMQAAIDNDGTKDYIVFPGEFNIGNNTLTMNRRQHWMGLGMSWDTVGTDGNGGSLLVNNGAKPVVHMKSAGCISDICLQSQHASGTLVRFVSSELNTATNGNQASDSVFENVWCTGGAESFHIDGITGGGLGLQGMSFNNVCIDGAYGAGSTFKHVWNIWINGSRLFAGATAGVVFEDCYNLIVDGDFIDYNVNNALHLGTPAVYGNLDHSAAALYFNGCHSVTVDGCAFNANFIAIGMNDCEDGNIGANTYAETLDDHIRINASRRITVNGGSMRSQNNEWTTGRAHVRTTGTCEMVGVGGMLSMLGSAKRPNGVMWSAGTTKSVVGDVFAKTVTTPYTDANGTNPTPTRVVT